MELEELAEPSWSAEQSAACYARAGEEPVDWTSDYPISMDEALGWVDAYEL